MATHSEIVNLVINAVTKGATGPMNDLQKSSKDTEKSLDNLSTKGGKLGGTLRAGLAGAAGAFVGVGLAAVIDQTAGAFADAALAADQLSRSTNGSMDSSSRFLAVAGKYGLEMNDLVEIFSDFQQAAGKSGGELEKLGVTMSKNADGTIDWIATAVDFLDTVNKIPDATERNRLMFKYFGEEGAKQLQLLVNAGVAVEDQMKAISTAQVFNTDDVLAARDYNQSMQQMGDSAKALQFTLGRELAPIVATVLDAFIPMVDLLGKVPGDVYLVVGAMAALRYAMGTSLVQAALAPLALALTGLPALFASSATAMAGLGAAARGLGAAFMTLAAEAAPLLLLAGAIIAVKGALDEAGATKAFTAGTDALGKTLRQQGELKRDTDSFASTVIDYWKTPPWQDWDTASVDTQMRELTGSYRTQAEETLNLATATETQKVAAQNLLDVIGTGSATQQANNLATDEGTAAMQAYEASLSSVEAVAQKQVSAQEALNTATVDYLNAAEPTAAMMSTLVDAAVEANNATLEQKRATELTAIAQGQYATSIQETIKWQQKLSGLTVDIESGLNDVQEAYGKLSKTTDDKATWGDEWAIQAETAQQSIFALTDAWAASGMTSDEIITKLVEIKSEPGASDQLKKDVDFAISKVSGKGNEIPVNLKAQMSEQEITAAVNDINGKIQKKIDSSPGIKAMLEHGVPEGAIPDLQPLLRQRDELLKPLPAATQEVTLTGPGGAALPESLDVKVNLDTSAVDTATATVATLAETPVDLNLNVQGVEDATNVVNGLTHDKEIRLNVNVQGRGDAENVIAGLTHDKEIPLHVNVLGRRDAENVIAGLTHDKEIPLHVNIHGRQDAENVLNGLDNDRYVTVHVSTQGVQAAREQIDGLGRTSSLSAYLGPSATLTAAPVTTSTVLQTVNVNVSGAGSPATTAREIDRYIRRAGDARKASVTA